MKRVELREFETTQVQLDRSELAVLSEYRKDLFLTIEPSGEENVWWLTPGSRVGAVDVGDVLSVSIQPKLEIGRVFFLASYALGEFRLRDLESFLYAQKDPPLETMARFFADAAQRAFARGLLHGYRSEEEALLTVRGRIRFDEQIRRRFGVPLPVEVRYDDFTEDVLANRLVKAAALALGTMRLQDPKSRIQIGRVAATLENVTSVSFALRDVPKVTFDRLNEHYRRVIGLSRLILRHATVETGRGTFRAAGFLMDMNKVFERFVRRALREELRLAEREFPANRRLRFDAAANVPMEPDLSWWTGGTCVFAGDAKYKRLDHQHAPNADLYQLLAYITALGLQDGMLIYAQGAGKPETHHVRRTNKRLHVATLDLTGEPADIVRQIRELARRIHDMSQEAGTVRAA